MEHTLTPEMITVLAVLGLTIFLFVSEIVRVDVAAVLVMILLGLLGLVDADRLFDGFASNAVVSIIAVMIIGAGLDRTGLMNKVAAFILRIGGRTEARLIPIISGTVGVISSFMQNVGAAALFLPVVQRISERTGIPASRLLMPMGFTAILGGTMTMVGSSPLILLNDLILTANEGLPEGTPPMDTFGLFDVTPIGLALVATGIVYFIVAGRFVLPVRHGESRPARNTLDFLREVYGFEGDVFELRVQPEACIAGRTVGDVEAEIPGVHVLAIRCEEIEVAPPRETVIEAGCDLAVIGRPEDVRRWAARCQLTLAPELDVFTEIMDPARSGIAEVVVPPSSGHVGKSLGELRLRKRFGVSVLAVHRGGKTVTEHLRDWVLKSGDALVVHATWEHLARLDADPGFVVATDYPREELRPHKAPWALLFFAVALGLVLFTDLKLSLALLTGAMGMVVSRVLTMDEAYRAVSWTTVFLLASLIPLGLAFETSGAAAWIAHQTLGLMGDVPTWVLQAAIAALATFFTLVMSNVGATVLLVPLAVNIALQAGADPALFALTVALATSNSFLIPTHQVNALIMGPGGYRNADFLRAGGGMTVLFLVVLVAMLNLFY